MSKTIDQLPSLSSININTDYILGSKNISGYTTCIFSVKTLNDTFEEYTHYKLFYDVFNSISHIRTYTVTETVSHNSNTIIEIDLSKLNTTEISINTGNYDELTPINELNYIQMFYTIEYSNGNMIIFDGAIRYLDVNGNKYLLNISTSKVGMSSTTLNSLTQYGFTSAQQSGNIRYTIINSDISNMMNPSYSSQYVPIQQIYTQHIPIESDNSVYIIDKTINSNKLNLKLENKIDTNDITIKIKMIFKES